MYIEVLTHRESVQSTGSGASMKCSGLMVEELSYAEQNACYFLEAA
jgi:hypothetical protein